MAADIRTGVVSSLPRGVLNSGNARAANKALDYSRALEMKGNGMLSQSNTYTAFGKGTKAARVVKGTGAALGVLGFVVGYWLISKKESLMNKLRSPILPQRLREQRLGLQSVRYGGL